MKLIYIGSEFYMKSGTMMSCLKHEDTGHRADWGQVEIALERGEEVSIRPANDAELGQAYKQLTEIQKKRSA